VEELRRRNLSRSHGVELCRLTSPEQQVKVARRIKGRCTEKQTRLMINSLVQRKGKRRRTGPPPSYARMGDPLHELWPKLSIAMQARFPGSWSVQYEGGNVWDFRVHTNGDPIAQLADWCSEMSRNLAIPSKGDPPSSLAAETAPIHTELEAILKGDSDPDASFAEPAAPAAPEITLAELGSDHRAHLEWTPVPGADQYEVFFSTHLPEEALRPIKANAVVKEPRHRISMARVESPAIWFAVRARNHNDESPLSEPVKVDLRG
jgi:hypothetical protein